MNMKRTDVAVPLNTHMCVNFIDRENICSENIFKNRKL